MNKLSLTNLIQLQGFVLYLLIVKQLLDLGAEGAGGLAEDHHLVVTDVLLHLLHGGAGDGSHPAGGPDLVPGVHTSVR